MKLTVRRFLFEDSTSIGMLLVNEQFFCWTLEDIPRTVKVWGETAIPVGVYNVEITSANKWGKPMLHIMNVPNFEGIYIHAGNTNADTLGCVLVGTTVVDTKTVAGSKSALGALMEKVGRVYPQEQIIISIENYAAPVLP